MSLSLVRTGLAATLSAALLLSGCGDGGSDGDAAAGSASTSPSASASGDADASESAEPLTSDNLFARILAAQQEAGSYRATGTTTTAGVAFEQQVEATYESGELFAHVTTMPGSEMTMEAILAGGVMYLKAAGVPTPGDKWLVLDPSDPELADSPFGAISEALDPQTGLKIFGDALSVEEVGAEAVEGVDATHYRATVASATYGDAFGLPEEVLSALPEELVFDLWVDGDDRLVKQSQEATIAGKAFATEQVYSDYGADISIDVPAEADTVSFSELG